MNFIEKLNELAEMTESKLAYHLSAREPKALRLDNAIAYSLLGGGKRLRAYITNEFASLCGRNDGGAVDYACALEMIHAFSLIHDDLPAMDDDDMRRGKPSNHKQFGEATAILAGDSLALDAFGVICKTPYCSPAQNELAVIALSDAAGSFGMCAGQQTDIDSEGKAIDIETLTRLVDLKTGALFSCACALGCIAASASMEQLELAKRFGILIGRAFQITDDLLDIYSSPEVLGKTVGKDIAQEKSTFVSILGEDGAKKHAEDCISEAKSILLQFPEGESRARLWEFCDYILVRKK